MFSIRQIVLDRDNPREIRNRAEKMRRDRLNQSVAELAAMVPPVVAARRKIDKTTVLRLTAHYLRAHQYVFGDSIGRSVQEFSPASVTKVLSLFNGFLITVTYRGIIVVVSQNVQQYLGYTELDLLGQNLLNITHEDDRATLKDQLMPKSQHLGPNGELLIPDEPGAKSKVEEALAQEKREFIIRFKKLGQRSEPSQYVTCHVQGSLRKSDRACSGLNRCCQIVRRVRARTENPCSSGNDIVFIGVVRPSTETFINESALEAYRMEYRTRHSIDGQIIQCESRIALVTGYMTHEVSGVNAMNFMHRDDVRWVIVALREMYDHQKMYGESCYRLMTKNGQFIYMRTRGRLDVDQDSGACTSFVCTNAVVDEKEGKQLIKLMRKKFTMMINNETPGIEMPEEEIKDEENDSQTAPVENPRRLEEVILHLVTNLPSPPTEDLDEDVRSITTEKNVSPSQRITIIPPDKEQIVNAIDKIYGVIKTLNRNQDMVIKDENIASNPLNRRSSCPKSDEILYSTRDTLQDCKIVELSPSDTNKIYHFGKASPSALAGTNITSNSANIINPEPQKISNFSPNLGSFDKSTSGFSSSSFSNCNINSKDTYNDHDDNGLQFHTTDLQKSFFPMARLPDEPNFIQMLPEPKISNLQTGTKRPSDFEDEKTLYKKKIGMDKESETSDIDSQYLEHFFDETLFNTQIETAINSLDTIDPTFPDLLVSTEVQDILGEFENSQVNEEFPD
ncbi:unnamed protein product [Arctia plantaginis]|uniref:Methoprene-tolerant protein n=1 Tax=Arctia plantaginis TaxID=874455 RepID=A0A8S0Z1A1_ARCPL|nr:unnamed protein product [Arctia plantaginis]